MHTILITGAGATLGQSIYKAIKISDFKDSKIIFCNSDIYAAGAHFNVDFSIVPLANDANYLSAIDKLVKANNVDIIFPGTQHELKKLSEYSKSNCRVACFPYKIIDLAINKHATMRFLDNNGITIPYTVKSLDAKKENIPFVLKPKVSSASRNILFIRNVKDFYNLNMISYKDYIAQEYIDGEEYTCGCYIDRYSHDVNFIIIKRMLSRDGASSYGEVVNNSFIENYLKEICKSYMKKGLEYGHLNVQLKLNNNSPVCFEINGRLSSTEAPKAHFGFNSVEAYIYNIVLKQKYVKLKPIIGSKFIRYYEEIYF